MKKEDLLARAQELEITVPEKATNEEISNLIMIAEHPLLKAEIAEKDNVIESLEKQLNSTTEAKVLATYVFEDKTKVGITSNSIKFKRQKFTAKEAVENAELMNAMRNSGSIHLKPLK
tara:strand:- start:175 stop:528 length:354 start_codon:yes stop_codon:yes gene_type:complete